MARFVHSLLRLRNPMTDSMGMIQVEGVSYRIAHLGRNDYEVVRLLDDISLGSFNKGRAAITCSLVAGEHSLRDIARVAVRQGKTKWKPAAPTSCCKAFVVERMGTIASYFQAKRQSAAANSVRSTQFR